MSFFQELWQRRLFQIVATYAAAGWIALQVFDQLADRGVLPNLAYHIALVWYLAGLLAAVVAGWHHGEKGRQRVVRSEVALLCLSGILGVVLTVLVVKSAAEDNLGVMAGSGGLDPRSVAVLYLEDASGNGSLAYVADGLTEALIRELGSVSTLNVLTVNGALQYRDSDLSLVDIAQEVRAGTVVTGSVDSSGDELRVNVAISDGESGDVWERESFEVPAADLFGLEDRLAEEVALLLRDWLGHEVDLRRGRRETENVAAWATLQRAERARKDAEESILEDDMEATFTALTRADSLASDAETMDPNWAAPSVVRGEISRRLVQMSASDPLEADVFIQEGYSHTERALEKDPNNAAALENRGVLRYFQWALNPGLDHAEAQSLLRFSEEDLREATRQDPTRANAHNVLSRIHSQKPDPVESKLAAQRAYEADAYLRAADGILWGLYATSYDLEQFPDAVRYCEEGHRRFPDDARFVECELWLLSSPAVAPDVDRAWALMEQYVEMAPAYERDYVVSRGGLLVGGVLAMAELTDSADAVLRQFRSDPALDPGRELLSIEAVFRLRMDQEDEALNLVKLYLTASPEHREGWEWSSHWWWRPLQDNPEFRDLVGSGPPSP